jgi:hypothetical protein
MDTQKKVVPGQAAQFGNAERSGQPNGGAKAAPVAKTQDAIKKEVAVIAQKITFPPEKVQRVIERVLTRKDNFLSKMSVELALPESQIKKIMATTKEHFRHNRIIDLVAEVNGLHRTALTEIDARTAIDSATSYYNNVEVAKGQEKATEENDMEEVERIRKDLELEHDSEILELQIKETEAQIAKANEMKAGDMLGSIANTVQLQKKQLGLVQQLRKVRGERAKLHEDRQNKRTIEELEAELAAVAGKDSKREKELQAQIKFEKSEKQFADRVQLKCDMGGENAKSDIVAELQLNVLLCEMGMMEAKNALEFAQGPKIEMLNNDGKLYKKQGELLKMTIENLKSGKMTEADAMKMLKLYQAEAQGFSKFADARIQNGIRNGATARDLALTGKVLLEAESMPFNGRFAEEITARCFGGDKNKFNEFQKDCSESVMVDPTAACEDCLLYKNNPKLETTFKTMAEGSYQRFVQHGQQKAASAPTKSRW